MSSITNSMGRQEQVAFVTFGMFIIDKIEWITCNPQPAKDDLVGGAGTYAVLGARLTVSPSLALAKQITWIVDVGSDFPAKVRQTLEAWHTNCIFREDLTRLTTRGWNGYGENERRDFKYTSPKVRLEVDSFSDAQICSKSFHMVCSSDRSLSLTTDLLSRRESASPGILPPVVVWEPIPDLCNVEEVKKLRTAAQYCTVVSPNHEELRRFFSSSTRMTSQQLVEELLDWNDTNSKTLGVMAVIREGADGSTVYFRRLDRTGRGATMSIHVAAFHSQDMTQEVIDPTGGGNTYLGALAIALTGILQDEESHNFIYNALNMKSYQDDERLPQKIENTIVAMIYASIAASFAIEQNGVPEHRGEGGDFWNNTTVLQRLKLYLEREGAAIRKQIGAASNRCSRRID